MESLLFLNAILQWTAILFQFLLIIAVIRRVNQPSVAPFPTLEAGTPAPSFEAKMLDDTHVTLSNFAGKNIAFVFVTPTCSHCLTQLPRLEELKDVAHRAGVELYLVGLAAKESMQKFVDEFSIRLPVLVAPHDDSTFGKDYLVGGTPWFCLVDDQGKVSATGMLDDKWEQLAETWRTSKARAGRRLSASKSA